MHIPALKQVSENFNLPAEERSPRTGSHKTEELFSQQKMKLPEVYSRKNEEQETTLLHLSST